MNSTKNNFKTIDEYIKTFPKDIRKILETVRQTIKKAAPEAEEAISYQMPTFKLNGNLSSLCCISKIILDFIPDLRN